MLSEEVLKLVLSESETMITEWADTRDGPGYSVIEGKISDFLNVVGYDKLNDHDLRQQITTNVRTFILYDMAIMSW